MCECHVLNAYLLTYLLICCLSISQLNLKSTPQRTFREVLLILQILLTYKKLYHRALAETDVIVDVHIAHCNDDEMTWSCERLLHDRVISVRSGDSCNLKQLERHHVTFTRYVMAAWHPRLTYRHTDTRTISLTIIYTVCQKSRPPNHGYNFVNPWSEVST